MENQLAFIEIPKGSNLKYEIDKVTNLLVVDRKLNQNIPHNYGFIPKTLAPDGDALDIFIVSAKELKQGETYQVEIYGALICTDQGVSDDKVIASLIDDDISNEHFHQGIRDIVTYLQTYKTGFTIVKMVDTDQTKTIIKDCNTQFLNQNET